MDLIVDILTNKQLRDHAIPRYGMLKPCLGAGQEGFSRCAQEVFRKMSHETTESFVWNCVALDAVDHFEIHAGRGT